MNSTWFFFSCIPTNSLFFCLLLFFLFRLLYFYFKPHIVTFPCLIPFCLLPALSYFCFKFYFPPFYALFPFLILTISPPSILWKSLFFLLAHSCSFSLSCNSLIFFLSLLIVACLAQILWLLLFFFNVIPISSLVFYFKSHRLLSPCLTPFCFCPAHDYLSLEFYFLPFLARILFLTLIISPPSLFPKSLLFTVDISYYLFSFL